MLTRTFSNPEIFKKRRERLNSVSEDSVFILYSGAENHYLGPFRANSHFVYMTGFEEPDSWAVIRTGAKPQFTLFVREKDPAVELWDGERYGTQLAKKEFKADVCYATSLIESELKNLLRGTRHIYFALGEDQNRDKLIIQARAQAQQLDRRSGLPPSAIFDPNEVLANMRVVKDDHEIQWMREVCELSAQTHKNVMKNVRPGLNEKQIQGQLIDGFFDQLAFSEAYTSIVASGENATTLHYRANNRTLESGELLLIDAGAEKNYYRADITRTYPVNGQFSAPQKALYQAVLDVQKNLIKAVQPGASIVSLQELAVRWITEKLVELGILKGAVSELISNNAHLKYYPHFVGHYLGMDVHDVGYSKKGQDPVPFVAGTIITVEPGIYIPATDNSAPAEFRGLGVRIEDDVLVTAIGQDVLTHSAPKEVAELEAIIGSAS